MVHFENKCWKPVIRNCPVCGTDNFNTHTGVFQCWCRNINSLEVSKAWSCWQKILVYLGEDKSLVNTSASESEKFNTSYMGLRGIFPTDNVELSRKWNPFSWEFPIDSLANFNKYNCDSPKRVLSFRHRNEKRGGSWWQETAQFAVCMFGYHGWKFPIADFN